LYAQNFYRTTADVKLRSGPDTKYKSLGIIKNGEKINVIEKRNTLWLKIEHNGKTGYLSSKFLIPVDETQKIENLPKPEKRNSTSSLLYIIGGGVIVVLIFFASWNNKKKETNNVRPNQGNKTQRIEIKPKDELIENILKNIKIEVTTNNSNRPEKDDSIIDVTGNVYNIINLQPNLVKYSAGVPTWKHQYIYSSSEINYATSEQIKFYNFFRYRFLKGEYIDLEGNSNYSFILLFDLIDDYETHKNLLLVERQLEELGQYYPKTKPYLHTSLFKKLEQIGDSGPIEQLKNKQGTASFQYRNPYSQLSFEENNWGLGTKYQKELNLLNDEVEVLNFISYYSNTFFDIKNCGTEIIKLFLALREELDLACKSEGSDLNSNLSDVADIIVTKQLKYRPNTESYKYAIETYKRVIYTAILKNCENSVREKYFHKRKLNADLEYINQEYKSEYETKILQRFHIYLPRLISSINLPDEDTEIELYSQNTNRWKVKFEELTANYKNNPKEFVESVVSLGNLNKKNPSVENIFFEASKFISKSDKESALSLYVHYLYHDLKSATFDNKQLTKTIQKSLFKTNEQLHDFEIIVSELMKDKDLEKALKSVSKVYEIKRKKIQLDTDSINEVQQQHSGTVKLLNEYLKDDYEDETSTIKTEEINNEEIKIEITQKGNEVAHSAYLSDIVFKPIQITALELFSKSNFSISQSELESFAKSKGVFKDQLIESINETCFDFLDDVLIEEEDEYFTINTDYFQRILQNDRQH
jgi:hypothetical protein